MSVAPAAAGAKLRYQVTMSLRPGYETMCNDEQVSLAVNTLSGSPAQRKSHAAIITDRLASWLIVHTARHKVL